MNNFVMLLKLDSEPTPILIMCYFQERFLCALVAASRVGWRTGQAGWALSESSLSLDSILMGGAPEEMTTTPDAARRHTNPLFSRAMGTLRYEPNLTKPGFIVPLCLYFVF